MYIPYSVSSVFTADYTVLNILFVENGSIVTQLMLPLVLHFNDGDDPTVEHQAWMNCVMYRLVILHRVETLNADCCTMTPVESHVDELP
jgi:hypothetical protein